MDFLMVWIALSAAPFDHGEAVEHGRNRIPNCSINCLNSEEFCIDVSLSDLMMLGRPKGIRMVSVMAWIISLVRLFLMAFSWIYPVNISTAKKMDVLPFLVSDIDGMMSIAHVALGDVTKLVVWNLCGSCLVLFIWHWTQVSQINLICAWRCVLCTKYWASISLVILVLLEWIPMIE